MRELPQFLMNAACLLTGTTLLDMLERRKYTHPAIFLEFTFYQLDPSSSLLHMTRQAVNWSLFGREIVIMGNQRQPLVFISYRRIDSAPAARLLSSDLRAIFGLGSVFIDTNDIRIGTAWPERIDERLQAASVLLAVIGPTWLRVADDAGRRRLDKPKDWVRNEIAYAIENKRDIIPFLIAGANLPDKSALPKRIDKLADQQAIKVDYETWDNDLNPLIRMLEEVGFQRTGSAAPVRLPRPPKVKPNSLTQSEIENALKALPEWQLITSFIPGEEPNKRTELMRTYEFARFEDAIDFMAEATKHISDIQHHPRWENTWRTVRVWLSTWDIGHKPSQYDLDLAEYLDTLFRKYPTLKSKK